MRNNIELLPYQERRIEIIKSVLPIIGNDFVLKGGTALFLYYGLDRFSEDIDLDSFDNEMVIINKLQDLLPKDFEIREKKNTETVYRVMIDYKENKYPAGDYPLKIEISSRNSEDLNKGRFEYSNRNGVNVYDIEEIKNMKVMTFGRRDKIRDLYDIGFLLRKYPEIFNKQDLVSIRTEINQKGWDELSNLLKAELMEHHLIPETIDPDAYLIKIYEKCDNLLREMENKKNKPKGRMR